jgi:TolB-like protein
VERRLVTILAADVVGYSKQMEAAEEATAARLSRCQSLIEEMTAQHGGRVFNRAGDSALAEFQSPVNAVRCGVEIQRDLAANLGTSEKSTDLKLRIGVHLADVILSGSDLIGDGVNIASRIQEIAEPESVLVSEALFEQVRRQSPFMFKDLGPQKLKNISEQIRLYQVTGANLDTRFMPVETNASPSATGVRDASVAVLPFTVSGGDEEQRYFAEGLTDDIIVELARFKKLFVSSRSASFAFAAQNIDPREAARELAVKSVLEGEVRRLGNQVRISVRLIDTQSGDHLWAERFNGPLEHLFDLLDELVGRIVVVIVGRIEAADIAASKRKRPEDMTAYDCVLRGLEYHRLGGVTLDNERRAVEWFSRAIERDPDYGVAYAWHVCASSHLPEFDEEEGFRNIQKAMELDENEPETHRIMGEYFLYFREFEKAELYFIRAMSLNPSDAYLKALCANFFNYKGEPARALELIEEAETRDPFLPAWCIDKKAAALYGLGRHADALLTLDALPIPTFQSHCYEAACRAASGDHKGSTIAVAKALKIYPELTMSEFATMEPYRDEQDWIRLRDLLICAGLPQ